MGWSIVDLSRNPHAVCRQNGQPDKERDTAKQLVLLATSVCASLCELGSWAGCWCSRLASADVHLRVIWLRPKGKNYTEEAAGARHAHMTAPLTQGSNHSDDHHIKPRLRAAPKVSRATGLCARLCGRPATCRAEEMRERPRIRRAGKTGKLPRAVPSSFEKSVW